MTGVTLGSSNGPTDPKDQNDTNGQGGSWATRLVVGLAIAAIVMVTFTMFHGGIPTQDRDSAAVGASDTSGAMDQQHVVPTGEVVTKDISITGMSYSPSVIEVPRGATLIVNVTNKGTMQHDLTLNGQTTKMLSPGQSDRLDAGVIGQDSEGWCTVAGHRQAGMVLQVTVVDSDHASQHSHGPGQSHSARGESSEHKVRDARLPAAKKTAVHELTMVMTEEVREVAPGKKQMQWLFNGQAPGPVLRGTVGDRFRITLKNEGSMGHSVDFHAGEVSPDATMATIQPGEELVYEFTARRAGAWMYHCGTNPMSLHIANGMAGMMVIDPAPGSELALDPVDHEFALAAHEVFLGDEKTGADAAKVRDDRYDLAAFNGYPNQYADEPLRVKVGERVRIWVVNLGPTQALSFHVVGAVFDTVFSEGNYSLRHGIQQNTGAQVLPLLAAQGGFVEIEFAEAGTYTMVNHATAMMEKGQMGRIIVEK
ncbi:multicopper oxidase domain-containing protein [Corynebacterium sp. zg254]|uniref:Copper-containing nitrite reductase n=1 Tax=Corynebacterium zhongnanshanii TaxID=2768834 RepID=A0ABQ6VGV5_9CORY|nr:MULTISPECIES: multicopper oxidase domain-containing protein [Corynebacterium]KAB3520859.1 multicopper oxidase domain-containing protein [Corynebacterium zhongnanshanii]MCR5914483.1 multicopper oxidase domain-containing protein [Corynebacterium sp. zg254]